MTLASNYYTFDEETIVNTNTYNKRHYKQPVPQEYTDEYWSSQTQQVTGHDPKMG